MKCSNLALYSVHMCTQADEAILKLLNGLQSLCIKTGSDRKCDNFDGKYRDEREPYFMTLQLTYSNYETIQFH